MKVTKFRHWDEEGKSFDFSELIGLDNFFYYFPGGGDQFIGRTDALGKDIYEQDFVRHRYKDDEPYEVFLIRFIESDAHYVAEDFTGWIHINGNMEIIGNAHANPELDVEK